MEHVGVQVGAVRPHDRSELFVHAHLSKELRIVAERFEHGSPQLSFEVDLAHGAVVEAEPKDEAFKWLDRADTRCARSDAHGSGSIVSRGRCASALAQFASSSARCIPAHSCTSFSARAGSSPARGSRVSITMGFVLGVDRVKVRRVMVPVVHRDHDPVPCRSRSSAAAARNEGVPGSSPGVGFKLRAGLRDREGSSRGLGSSVDRIWTGFGSSFGPRRSNRSRGTQRRGAKSRLRLPGKRAPANDRARLTNQSNAAVSGTGFCDLSAWAATTATAPRRRARVRRRVRRCGVVCDDLERWTLNCFHHGSGRPLSSSARRRDSCRRHSRTRAGRPAPHSRRRRVVEAPFSPRALRSSTNDPEAFAKGDVPTSQDGRSSRYDDVNAGVRELESSNGRYDAPYADRGGIYSRPRRKH